MPCTRYVHYPILLRCTVHFTRHSNHIIIADQRCLNRHFSCIIFTTKQGTDCPWKEIPDAVNPSNLNEFTFFFSKYTGYQSNQEVNTITPSNFLCATDYEAKPFVRFDLPGTEIIETLLTNDVWNRLWFCITFDQTRQTCTQYGLVWRYRTPHTQFR